jgi:hypothetical protein
MRSTAFLFLFIGVFVATAQDKKSPPYELYVSKGSFQIGLQKNFNSVYSPPTGLSALVFNPRISYFILDRLSIGAGYSNISFNRGRSGSPVFYNNGEFDLKYYLSPKKPVSFYVQAGYYFGQYYAPERNWVYSYNNELTSLLKVGAGINWRLKALPVLSFNAEINNYVNLKHGGLSIQNMPPIFVGINYSFLSKRKKKKFME